MAERVKVQEPWHPAPWSNADCYAIKALAKGTASESQQKRALALIVERIAGTFDLSFRPGDSSRTTDFAEGKRYVGLQIVKLINMPEGVMKKATK